VRRSLLSVIKLQHRFQRLRHPAEQKIDATIKIVNKKATTRCLYVFLFGVAEQRASERVSSSSHLARIWAIVLHAKELLSVDSRVESAQTLFHITRNNQAPCFASFRTQKTTTLNRSLWTGRQTVVVTTAAVPGRTKVQRSRSHGWKNEWEIGEKERIAHLCGEAAERRPAGGEGGGGML
jgi:hypothetical protein